MNYSTRRNALSELHLKIETAFTKKQMFGENGAIPLAKRRIDIEAYPRMPYPLGRYDLLAAYLEVGKTFTGFMRWWYFRKASNLLSENYPPQDDLHELSERHLRAIIVAVCWKGKEEELEAVVAELRQKIAPAGFSTEFDFLRALEFADAVLPYQNGHLANQILEDVEERVEEQRDKYPKAYVECLRLLSIYWHSRGAPVEVALNEAERLAKKHRLYDQVDSLRELRRALA